MMQNVKPKTDNVILLCQTSTDGGSNFATTNGDYREQSNQAIGFNINDQAGNAATEYGISGRFELYAPHLTNFTYGLSISVVMTPSGEIINNSGAQKQAGVRLSAADVDAVRFIFSSGGIDRGEIAMHGIANA